MDKQKQVKKKKRFPVWLILALAVALGAVGYGAYLILFPSPEAFARQDEEGDLANQYVDDMVNAILNPDSTKAHGEKETTETDRTYTEEEKKTLEYIDDPGYYTRDGITYTPDYAKGYIECVLMIPSVGINRGVYSGTMDDILFDLDIWMVTAALPDYKLGETRYCIYGHNHTVQNLSFNRLREVQLGEPFYLISQEEGYFEYEITKIFAVSREAASTDYVYNEDIGSDKCYIITCGRDENRYKDLIVEGTLKRHLTPEEFAQEYSQNK